MSMREHWLKIIADYEGSEAQKDWLPMHDDPVVDTLLRAAMDAERARRSHEQAAGFHENQGVDCRQMAQRVKDRRDAILDGIKPPFPGEAKAA